MLDELYVVRDRGGGLFADVFAIHEFRYRVTELPGSGQLAVDFRGVREELDFPPATSDRVVVVQPREAEEVASPLIVEGYSHFSGGEVKISLFNPEREVIGSKTVRIDGRDAAVWSPFRTTLEFSGSGGLATLHVDSRVSSDEPFAGTATEVFVE